MVASLSLHWSVPTCFVKDHRSSANQPATCPFSIGLFPKQFTVRGSQCFKEWSPWCWMVWSGSRPACLPLPFICLPVLFICLPSSVLVVGFPVLSPTSFHLSPSSFLLSPSSCHLSPQAGCLWSGSRLACLPLPFICLPLLFICLPGWVLVVGFPAGLSPTSFHLSPSSFHLSPKLGACGRVPGLVSHFLSFVSQFFSFVSQAGCLWSGSRLACLPLPFICLPLLFICLPLLFICLPGSVLVVGFPLVSHFLSHFFSFVSQFFSLSPRLGACGRVCGWLVSHVVSFVSHFFSFVSHFFSFVSQFFSFVSQAGCLWSGSRLACLPLPFICLPLLFIFCLPGWVLVVGFPAGLSPTSCHLSPTSFHFLSPRLGACGRVPGWLVSHFLSFVSGFPAGLSRTSFHLSPTSFHLSPFLSFLCLPGSVLVVLFPLVSHFLSHFFSFVSQFFSLSPRLGACGRVCGWLVSHVVSFVSHFFSFVSHFFSFVSQFFSLSPRLGACGRVCGWLVSHVVSFVSHFFSFVSHFFSFVSQFFSFVSQAGCLWSGSRLACLPLPFICLPLLFIFCLPGWVLVVGFPAGLSRTFLSFVSFPFICLSPRLGACGRVPACLPLPFPLLFICLPVLFICLPGWVLVVGFPAGLSPTSFHMSPTSFHFLSPRLGACGRVPGWLVSHLPFICLLSFHLFVSQARCLWSGSRLSPTSFPTSFHLSPSSFHCLPGWVLVVAGLRLACLPRRFICHICLPLLFIVYSFVFQVCRWWCPPFSDVDATCLFICLPALIQTSICLPVSGTCRVVSFLDRITGLCQIQMREEEA